MRPRPKPTDITGRRFGPYVAEKHIGYSKTKNPKALWLCKCDCGGYAEKVGNNLNDKCICTCNWKRAKNVVTKSYIEKRILGMQREIPVVTYAKPIPVANVSSWSCYG